MKLSYYYKKKKQIIDYMGGCCVICNSKENLEFDHIDRKTTSFRITERISYAFKKIKSELDKCQLLCYSCHRKKTSKEVEAKHGTDSRYRHHKCRCRPCVVASYKKHKVYRKTYEEKKKKLRN